MSQWAGIPYTAAAAASEKHTLHSERSVENREQQEAGGLKLHIIHEQECCPFGGSTTVL